MKKYLIFDFDGTIIDTNEVIFASWEATCNHFLGYSLSRKVIYQTFGETLEYTISQKFPDADPDEVLNYYKNYQSAHCEGMVSLFEGIRDILFELKLKGYKMAIATSRLTESFREYMDMFDLWSFFDAYICKEDAQHHKPHPQQCLVALEKLDATADEAVMLGDTRFDIGCANNAGVDSILVGWNPLVDLETVKLQGAIPKYFVRNKEELFAVLEQ